MPRGRAMPMGVPRGPLMGPRYTQTLTMTNEGRASTNPGVLQYRNQPHQQMYGQASPEQDDETDGILEMMSEAERKRQIRLLKNKQAAQECRKKRKHYMKCLEDRVTELENQNKALTAELLAMKECFESMDD